jgi:hypothetical protein
MKIARHLMASALALSVAGCVGAPPTASPGPSPTPTAVVTPAPTISTPPSAPPTIAPTLTPTVAPSASPTAEVTASPAPSVTPDNSGLAIAWRLSSGDTGLLAPYSDESGRVFHAGAVFAGRFFVAGSTVDEDFNEVPLIYWSGDGRTWHQADVPDLRTVSDLVVGPGALLAVGDSSEENTPLWLTTNGIDWERIVDEDFAGQRISKVGAVTEPPAGTDAGFVAVGTHMWWSEDGREWNATVSGPEIFPTELVRRGERFFTLTGGAQNGEPLSLWTSNDLIEWFAEGVELPHSGNAFNLVLAEGPLGFIAAAYDDEEEPAQTFMWFSADGFSWTEVAQPVGPVSDVFVTNVGFVAVGFLPTGTGCAIWEGDIQGFTWTSLDGQTWAKMPLEGFVGARVDQLFRDGRTLFGVGARYDEEVSDAAFGAVWTARLPQLQPAGPAPTPAPTPTPDPSGCGPG